MRLTEQLDVKAVSIVTFGCKPRKAAQKVVTSSRRRKSKKVAADKKAKVALRLETPLTRLLAELLGRADLLFENERDVPREGYTRLTLDVDYFSNVRVQVKNEEPDAVLDVIADRLDRWSVAEKKGVGPVLQWNIVTTGYVSQVADFVAAIDDTNFVVTLSPAQGALGFETAPPNKTKEMPAVYRVT